MSVGAFSGRIRWDGKTHPDSGWLMSWGPAKAAEHNVPSLCFLFTQKWTVCPVTLSCHCGILPQYMGPRNHGLTPLKQRAKGNPFSLTSLINQLMQCYVWVWRKSHCKWLVLQWCSPFSHTSWSPNSPVGNLSMLPEHSSIPSAFLICPFAY